MAARFFLGVHSLDQIIGGAAWGYVWFTFYKVFLEDRFDKIFAGISDGSWRKNLKYYLTLLIVGHIVAAVAPVLVYEYTKWHTVGHEQFYQLLFRGRCPKDTHYEGPLELILQRSGSINVLFGMIYGILLLPEKFRHQYMETHLSRWMKIARMIIMAVLVQGSITYIGHKITHEADEKMYRYFVREGS
eukprot:CAMPEP_0176426694 /NCGR_PEP_ID=MMETSP0127-20121128/12098_1 /TAXON_ID=938130 /ORGANISM="Platyophrya macrostoma, Strain WH" /LENGTH=187 /DNA_ID=CAMNT_0017808017 /DNA_START=519 /DNA_END=1078 /DNA_ORIENTATION=-